MSNRIRYWCMFRIRLDMAYIPVVFYHHNSPLDSYSSISLQKKIVPYDMLCIAFPMNHCMSNTMCDTMHSYTKIHGLKICEMKKKRRREIKKREKEKKNNKSNSVRNKLNCGFYYEICEIFSWTCIRDMLDGLIRTNAHMNMESAHT